MKYEYVLKKVKEIIPVLLKKFQDSPKVYIGKTENPKECAIRHEQDDKLFYLTILAVGDPSAISKLETEVIKGLKESRNIEIVNRTEISSGNQNADKLYVCFDGYLPKDDFGEYNLELSEEFPLTINE